MDDACDLMRKVTDPSTMLSVTLSECYASCDTDPSMVEMFARILYHITLRCFRYDEGGKYCIDTMEHSTFMNELYRFLREFKLTVSILTARYVSLN